jgi:hypothetical protein
VIVVLSAAAAFAAGGLASLLVPGLWRSRSPAAVRTVSGVSALAATLSPGSPTDFLVVDVVLRAFLGTITVLLAFRAGRRATLVTAMGAAAASLTSPAAWAGSAALGLSVATALTIRRAPLANAVVGALAVHAALRLDFTDRIGVTALTAALVLAPVTVVGFHRLRRRYRMQYLAGLGTAGTLAALAAGLGLVAALQARPALDRGLAEARAALAMARSGDTAVAGQRLRAASALLASAETPLASWWARPARAVPVVGAQLDALTAMAGAGADVSRAGAAAAAEADTESIRLTDGTLPVQRLAQLEVPLRRSLAALVDADSRLKSASSPWLVGPLSDQLSGFRRRVSQARGHAETGMLAARIAPALLGNNGPRRYFLAIQTPAELRATGGIIGNFGEITAVAGRLELNRLGRSDDLNFGGRPETRRLEAPADYVERYGQFRPERTWQNVTASPDFPTVARVIAALYPQSGGQPIDGVISVDPSGLASLLAVLGPVNVPGWPEPITAHNAERVLLHEQYLRFEPRRERADFLNETASTIWKRLTTTSLPGPRHLATALGPSVHGKHLLMWSARPSEQQLFERVGLDGAVPPVTGDSLGVITQNAGGTKLDWFLQRSIRYEAELDPSTGDLTASLVVRFENTAPARELPPGLVAPGTPAAEHPGENKLFMSIYTPWQLEGAELDGSPLLLSSEQELGRRVYSAFLTVPAAGNLEVRLRLSGRLPADPRYSLELLRQPTIRPDQVTASLRLSNGWEVDRSRGLRRTEPVEAAAAFALDRDRTLSAVLAR